MSKYRSLFRLAALAACALLSAAAAQAETVVKLGHVLSPTSAFQVGGLAFADEVAKQTGGRYRIEVVPNGALGSEKELVEKIKSNAMDLALTTTGTMGNFVPEVLITDLPFLFRDYDHARKVLDGALGAELAAKSAEKGIVVLAWGENGFRHLSNSKHPVASAADAKGLKIRTMENTVHMQAFRALGTFPTPMPFTELYGAMQAGGVDGQENPLAIFVSSNFSKVQKYLSLTAHVYSPAPFIASGAFYDKLPPADQAAFKSAAAIAAKAMRKHVSAVEKSAVESLRAQGVEVVASVDHESFVALVKKSAYPQYEKRFGAEVIEKVRAVH